jgi:hypothetical protein
MLLSRALFRFSFDSKRIYPFSQSQKHPILTSYPQTFTGALFSILPEEVTANGASDPTKPFTCASNTFSDLKSALARSCNIQNKGCSDEANKPANKGKGIDVSTCTDQQAKCVAAGGGGLVDKTLVDGSAEELVFC